ncbi:phasin family protein [Marinospirillum sp.]|uniref:phasin family protein n=1 Tax=Marinospirillum sp. TaxID=2183934 RepID=UPI002870B264|nr:phasin family protein [Marinospirillum sp.]MDR9468769.1 phasin family protein [Marinospirillum sp.]
MMQDKAMQEKMMNAFTEQTKNMYNPMRKINSLLVENMEKMTDFQLEALKAYSHMGLSQMKSATEVKDADSVRDYSASQAEMMSTLSKKVLEDAKTMADMSMEFKTEVEKILEESRSQAFNKAAEETKAAAKPAASKSTSGGAAK